MIVIQHRFTFISIINLIVTIALSVSIFVNIPQCATAKKIWLSTALLETARFESRGKLYTAAYQDDTSVNTCVDTPQRIAAKHLWNSTTLQETGTVCSTNQKRSKLFTFIPKQYHYMFTAISLKNSGDFGCKLHDKLGRSKKREVRHTALFCKTITIISSFAVMLKFLFYNGANQQWRKKPFRLLTLLIYWPLLVSSTAWDCASTSNTGTGFTRNSDCTISGGNHVAVSSTLEIIGSSTDVLNLVTITAASNKRHFYINGVNNKLILRYLNLTGGDVSNYTNVPDYSGGSICIHLSGTLLLHASIIANNKASFSDGDGGAIYANGNNINAVTITINQTVISKNEAGDDGGGMYLSDTTFSIVESSISENSGKLWGGGIRIEDSSGIIKRTTFTGNTAGGNGGGLYIDSDNAIEINQTIISKNEAGDDGGGMYLRDTTTFSIVESSISENSGKCSIVFYIVTNTNDTSRCRRRTVLCTKCNLFVNIFPYIYSVIFMIISYVKRGWFHNNQRRVHLNFHSYICNRF